MDLIALGDALLLPEDDLTLAAVLRSPLFGLCEEELFELAYDRGGASLYQRLQAARDRPPFAEAHERFARAAGPGGLSCRRSSSTPACWARAAAAGACSPASGRRRSSRSRRSSPRRSPSSRATRRRMQAFLHWLRADSDRADPRPRPAARRGPRADLPRRQGPRGADRVHRRCRLRAEHQGPAAVDRAGRACRSGGWGAVCGTARASAADYAARSCAQQQEQRRLLYVALTRARERLIVAGWQRTQSVRPPPGTTGSSAGMARLGAERVPCAGPGSRARACATAIIRRARPGAAAAGAAATGTPAAPRRRHGCTGRRRPRRAWPGAAAPLALARGRADGRALAAARGRGAALPARAPRSIACCRACPAARPTERAGAARAPISPMPALGARRRRAGGARRPRSGACSRCRSSRRCSARTRAPRCRSPAWSAIRRCSARSTGWRSPPTRCC